MRWKWWGKDEEDDGRREYDDDYMQRWLNHRDRKFMCSLGWTRSRQWKEEEEEKKIEIIASIVLKSIYANKIKKKILNIMVNFFC